MSRRVLLLVAAIVVAALGTTLVFLYVSGANDRALANQNPVEVLVAKKQIPAGTTIDQAQATGSIEQREMPKSAVVEGALSSTDPIKGEVALATLYPGQQIVATLFGSTSAAATTNVLAIPQGDVAVSQQFADPARVAGFVQPGSHVAIMLTGSVAGATGDFTRILLPNVLVIAVGPTTITPPANGQQANQDAPPRALLTLALSQADAQKLVYGSTKGSLYLALLNDKSKIDKGIITNSGNLFS